MRPAVPQPRRTYSLAVCWTSPAVFSNIPDMVRNLLEIGLTAGSSLVLAVMVKAKFNLVTAVTYDLPIPMGMGDTCYTC